jgi:putative DNA primase/helicase
LNADRVIARVTDPGTVLWNALTLARAGWHVFPVYLVNARVKADGLGVKADKDFQKARFRGKGIAWKADATTDPETVAEMFEANPGAALGISTGPSGLNVVDLDVAVDNTGAKSLKRAGIKLPKNGSFTYKTIGGGAHHYYRARDGLDAKTNSNSRGLEMVDIRGIGGMVVYYGAKLEQAPEVTAHAPRAILEVKGDDRKGGNITIQEWLDALHDPHEHPSKLVRDALAKFTTKGMSHDDMLKARNELVKLGRDGEPGVADALVEAEKRYTEGYDAIYRRAWKAAILDAVQMYGPPLPRLTIIQRPAPVKVTEYDEPTAPKDWRELTAEYYPSDFFNRGQLLTKTLASAVNVTGDLARGLDDRVWRYVNGVFVPDDIAISSRVALLLGNTFRTSHVSNTREYVRSHPDTPFIDASPHPALINCKNGMLDWRTGVLLPHDASHLSTVQLDVNYIVGKAKAKAFRSWLDDRVTPDTALLTWELIAYSVMSGNPFQKAAILIGNGGTGKGTVIRLIERIVGAHNVAHVTPAQMTERFAPADLFGKLLNTVGDLDTKYLPETGAFKRVTGGDTISAERKNRDMFSFTPWAFPIFGANAIASSADATEGFFRRWLPIRFDRAIDRTREFDEAAELHVETDQIFSRAVRLLPDMVERNDFTQTIERAQVEAEFREQSNVVATWLADDEHIVIREPGTPCSTRKTHAYTVYAAWCSTAGHGHPLRRTEFYRRMDMLGFQSYKTQGHDAFAGLKVDTLPMGQLVSDDDMEGPSRLTNP